MGLEKLHQGAFARTGHTGNDRQHALRDVHRQVLEVMQIGMTHREPALWLPYLCLECRLLTQHTSSNRIGGQQFRIGAFEHDFAAVTACHWSHIHQMIGHSYDFAVMLYNEHGVAMIAQMPQ